VHLEDARSPPLVCSAPLLVLKMSMFAAAEETADDEEAMARAVTADNLCQI